MQEPETFILLQPLRPHFTLIKTAHEKNQASRDIDTGTQNCVLYGPVSFVTKNGPEKNKEKEYEEKIMNVEGNCFYWFLVSAQFRTQELSLWNQLLPWHSTAGTARIHKVFDSHILLIINFEIQTSFWCPTDSN